MRYWLLGLGGIVLLAASLAAAATGLYGLLLTGTCASGGPYVSARPCPEGTGFKVMLLVVGIFTAMAGMGMFAARRGVSGASAGPASATGGVALASWFLGFGSLATAFLYAGFGPDATDPTTGWKIFSAGMGAMFFGLAMLSVLARRGRSKR
jgi:hypothetical protein